MVLTWRIQLRCDPISLPDQSSIHGPKPVSSCERVQVSGLSRLKLGSYVSSFWVTLAPSTVIPGLLSSECFIWIMSV